MSAEMLVAAASALILFAVAFYTLFRNRQLIAPVLVIMLIALAGIGILGRSPIIFLVSAGGWLLLAMLIWIAIFVASLIQRSR